MYRIDRQMKLSDFIFPYGTLDPENKWVRMAHMVDWDLVEELYAAHFENNGHPAINSRIALGALIIKERANLSDRGVVEAVPENPYMQYFLGLKEFTNKCPFGASTMVEFRKRFSEDDLAALLESTIPHDEVPTDDQSDEDGGAPPNEDAGGPPNEPPNEGTLVMDATCCPADITFPQDFQLLNDAREKLEGIIDDLCKANHLKKPRMYRQNARKDYLNLSKCKKRTVKKIKKCIKQQLQYIRRDIRYITEFIEQGILLTQKQRDLMNVITTVYEQQRTMYETNTHSIPDRIVSISQPWVRPIVRGKAHANTEFGAKLHISVVDGYARIEHLSFDAYNEANDFVAIVERFRWQYGYYPERVLADKIYRNRATIAYCKEHNIRLTGPALGRPKKDAKQTREAKRQEYQDICDRNVVEGVFGTGKTRYGLNRIMAHLKETSFCVIGIALLTMNLSKRLRSLFLQIFNKVAKRLRSPSFRQKWGLRGNFAAAA